MAYDLVLRRNLYCKQSPGWNEAVDADSTPDSRQLPYRQPLPQAGRLTGLGGVFRPTMRAVAPLSATVAAIASRPPRKPPFAVRNRPMMSGPKYPPRLASELITAIAAAAESPSRRDVAIAQKGPTIDSAQASPSPIAVTTTMVDVP